MSKKTKETKDQKMKRLIEHIKLGTYQGESSHVASKIVDEYMKWRDAGDK